MPWRTKTIAAVLAALTVTGTAQATERPANPQERWVIDQAVTALRNRGMRVPRPRVTVDPAQTVPAGEFEGTITLNAYGVQLMRTAERAAHTGLRRDRWWVYEMDAWRIGQAYYMAVHEVVHITQPHARTAGERPFKEGAADAIAIDVAPVMLRWRFGRVDAEFTPGYPALAAWVRSRFPSCALRVRAAARFLVIPGGWLDD